MGGGRGSLTGDRQDQIQLFSRCKSQLTEMKEATKRIITHAQDVDIPAGGVWLRGDLNVPDRSEGLVLFAHGSGSSRHSPRNQFVARTIREAGVGTLLFDLLTREEESVDIHTRHLRFDIGLLARRLTNATDWVKREADLWHLRIGYFGASTGGGAALMAAAEIGEEIGAVVSRGGRPALARAGGPPPEPLPAPPPLR